MALTEEQVVNIQHLAGYLEVTDNVRSCALTDGTRYMRIQTLTGWYTAHNIVQAVQLVLECRVERFTT